jgi:hypothetical protein
MAKSFTQAPKPPTLTPEQIVKPPAPSEPTKRLSLDLPQSLHRRFKTACSATDRKMVAEIEALIARRVVELEEEAGIPSR